MDCKSAYEQVARDDKQIAALREQFVCVRLEDIRGVDLRLFQFDYDMTMAVFFLSPDGKTIYARYGVRHPDKKAEAEFSAEGLQSVMKRVLAVHAKARDHAAELAGKIGPEPPWPTAGEIPIIKRMRPEGCLHCHNVFDGHRFQLKREPKTTPALRWPYPPPSNLGLSLSPSDPCKVLSVAEDSAAEKAGLRAGDRLTHVSGQLVLSIADVGWALHRAPDAGRLSLRYTRGQTAGQATLALTDGWRKTDLDWRPSADEWEELLEGDD